MIQINTVIWYIMILFHITQFLPFVALLNHMVFVCFCFIFYIFIIWNTIVISYTLLALVEFFFAYLLRSSYLTFEKASFKYSLFKATWNTKLVIETSQMRHKRHRNAMIDEIRHRFFVFILFISQPSQTTRDSVNQASRTEVKSPHPLHPCASLPHV